MDNTKLEENIYRIYGRTLHQVYLKGDNPKCKHLNWKGVRSHYVCEDCGQREGPRTYGPGNEYD